MERKVSIKLFGRAVEVTFSEDDLDAQEMTPAELRDAAKQHILDTVFSIGEAEPNALVRVTAIR